MQNGTPVRGVIALTLLALGGQAAHAERRVLDAAGAGLAIDGPCARHVTVAADPALTGRIAVTADADHPEEIAQLAVGATGDRARVGLRRGLRECWTPEPRGPFRSTLTLQIRVPAAFPVSVDDSGLGDYAIGAVGPLSVSASGMMTLKADAVDGDATVSVSGTGGIEIGRLDAARLTVELSGAGSLQVRNGRIGAVHVSNSGSTKVRIDPVVETASLATSGIGSITLGGVRGALSRASSGLGRITVAGRPPAPSDSDNN